MTGKTIVPDLMMRTARMVNRRSFLKGGAAATFSTLAAASVATAPATMAEACSQPCTGPYNTCSCGCACRGHTCSTCAGDVDCVLTTAFCPGGTGCWSSQGKLCCDCHCESFGHGFYCFCYG